MLRLSVGVGFWAILGLVLGPSCSASSSSAGVQGGVNSASGGVTSSGASTGSQPGFVISDASKNSGGWTTSDGEAVPCTNGDDCICPTLSVAVIGTRGQWGAQGNSTGQDSDTAFQDWLNSSSAGTARVDNYATKPTLTPDFLAGYNVIILAGLGDNSDTGPWWTFDSTSEVPAVADWVKKGGGLISLSGYSGDPGENTAKNALLAFAGISYNGDRVGPPCPADYRICGCSAGAAPITDWNQTDSVIAKLSLGVSMIGEVGGHSINAPASAHVAATTASGTSVYNLLVGEVVEQGRVLAYSDEWITYTSQWTGAGNPSTSDPSCQGYLPQERFQTAQFWYNMIRWSQPNATCFKIVDKQQPVTVW